MTAVAFSCISLRLKGHSLCEGVGRRRKLLASKLNARKYGHSAVYGNLGHFPHQIQMKFIVSDAFRVKIGCEDMFEQAWRYVSISNIYMQSVWSLDVVSGVMVSY